MLLGSVMGRTKASQPASQPAQHEGDHPLGVFEKKGKCKCKLGTWGTPLVRENKRKGKRHRNGYLIWGDDEAIRRPAYPVAGGWSSRLLFGAVTLKVLSIKRCSECTCSLTRHHSGTATESESCLPLSLSPFRFVTLAAHGACLCRNDL